MAKWKDQAVQLGMGTVVAGLKAVERGARRRARKVTGTKLAKNILVRAGKALLKEGLETAAVAAASGAALKVAGKLGRKVTAKVRGAMEPPKEPGTPARQA